MMTSIDGYSGKYNDIDYMWEKQDEFAIISFTIDGFDFKRKIYNVIAKPLDHNLIEMISGMEIDYSKSWLEDEKRMSEIVAGMRL